jgi:protein-S-isoprenylcysteine O-methyltransferase Ste14
LVRSCIGLDIAKEIAMSGERLAARVAGLAERERSRAFEVCSLLAGATIFLVVLPAVLIWIAKLLTGWTTFSLPRGIEGLISALSLAFGLTCVAWSAWTQWTLGHGTPAPVAPTRKLVVSGPYKYCRNPIQLGAMFYYLGLGILWGTIVTGTAAFVLGGIIGTLYHRRVEEKELAARFGEEYIEYKKSSNFLIPKKARK